VIAVWERKWRGAARSRLLETALARSRGRGRSGAGGDTMSRAEPVRVPGAALSARQPAAAWT